MEFEIVWTIDWQKYELENNDMKFTEINFARAFVFEFVWKFYRYQATQGKGKLKDEEANNCGRIEGKIIVYLKKESVCFLLP